MKTIPIATALLGLSVAAHPASQNEFDYEVVDGAIVVFGHRLVPAEPIPLGAGCDECETAHSIRLTRSPDQRWVLITSDVHLANFDAWIFDTESGSLPIRVADKRRGRHFTDAEWHSGSRFQLSFGGMGYAVALFFDVAVPDDAREIGDLLLYDAGRDVFVRYIYDTEKQADLIEIGSIYSDKHATARFPIALDNEFRSESRFMIESVEIDGKRLSVTYKTSARGLVKDVFYPDLLAKKQEY